MEGMLDVADRGAALMQIERLGLFPVAVDAAKGGAAAQGTEPRGVKINLTSFLPSSFREGLTRQRKPKLQELATFTNWALLWA